MTPTPEQIRAAYKGVDVLDPQDMFERAQKLMEPEIDRLRQQCNIAWNKADNLDADVEHLQQRIAEMEAEEEISDGVREKMSRILAEISIALKGEELPLQRHSYHDLAELVRINVLAVDIGNARIAALEASQTAIAKKALEEALRVCDKVMSDEDIDRLDELEAVIFKIRAINAADVVAATTKEQGE